MSRWILLGTMLAGLGCGDDDGRSAPDAALGLDASVEDAGLDADADVPDADMDADVRDAAGADVGSDADVESDAGEGDAGPGDAGEAGFDAGPDACHDLSFGHATVPIRQVSPAELPARTGGTIEPGIYDAVDAMIAGTTTGTFRATWRFESPAGGAATVDQIQQIALPTPGGIVPRTFNWSTSGTNLSRIAACPDDGTSFTNGYSVTTEGETTRLIIRQADVAFVFERR